MNDFTMMVLQLKIVFISWGSRALYWWCLSELDFRSVVIGWTWLCPLLTQFFPSDWRRRNYWLCALSKCFAVLHRRIVFIHTRYDIAIRVWAVRMACVLQFPCFQLCRSPSRVLHSGLYLLGDAVNDPFWYRAYGGCQANRFQLEVFLEVRLTSFFSNSRIRTAFFFQQPDDILEENDLKTYISPFDNKQQVDYYLSGFHVLKKIWSVLLKSSLYIL